MTATLDTLSDSLQRISLQDSFTPSSSLLDNSFLSFDVGCLTSSLFDAPSDDDIMSDDELDGDKMDLELMNCKNYTHVDTPSMIDEENEQSMKDDMQPARFEKENFNFNEKLPPPMTTSNSETQLNDEFRPARIRPVRKKKFRGPDSAKSLKTTPQSQTVPTNDTCYNHTATIPQALANLASSINRTTQSRTNLLNLRMQEQVLMESMQQQRKPECRSTSDFPVPNLHTPMEDESQLRTPHQSFSSNTSFSSITESDRSTSSFGAPQDNSSTVVTPSDYSSQHHDDQQNAFDSSTVLTPSDYSSQLHDDQQNAFAAVLASVTPKQSTMLNHADFANGQRSTLTDDLDESRMKLADVAKYTGVGLLMPLTMSKWRARYISSV